MNRRCVLKRAALLPVAPLAMTPPRAVRPTDHLKLSCNLYSFNRPLRSGEMSLEEVVQFCADLGFDAVDPTGYYFPGYPVPPPDPFVYDIKRLAFVNGLSISGTGVRNDFTIPDAGRRAADLRHVREWLGVAEKLGAPTLRVFAGHHDREGRSWEEVFGWVVESLRTASGYGAQHGVVVALQNHAAFFTTAEQLDRLFNEVESNWLALNLDIGSFRTADPYADIARAIRHAVTWQIKENVYVDGQVVPVDLDRLFETILTAGYRGYLPLETLGEGDPREKVPRFLDRVRVALARTA